MLSVDWATSLVRVCDVPNDRRNHESSQLLFMRYCILVRTLIAWKLKSYWTIEVISAVPRFATMRGLFQMWNNAAGCETGAKYAKTVHKSKWMQHLSSCPWRKCNFVRHVTCWWRPDAAIKKFEKTCACNRDCIFWLGIGLCRCGIDCALLRNWVDLFRIKIASKLRFLLYSR